MKKKSAPKRNFKRKASGQPRKDSSSPRVNFDNERLSKLEKDVEKGAWGKTSARNALSWYNKNPGALEGAANFSTIFPTGTTYPWLMPGNATADASLPVVMTLHMQPFFVANDASLNQAAESLYSYVVHANSRNKSYDPSDLFMMVLAGSMIFSGLAKGIRLYGTMTSFTSENTALPKVLVQGQGFKYSDAIENYSHMWADLNLRIARARDIWIPKDIPLLERWFWLNTNVYVDSDSIKDQLYVLSLDAFFKLDEIGSQTGGQLIPVTLNPNEFMTANVTWSKYLAMIDEMMDAFMASQDRGTMTGDMLKAYGAENLYQLKELDISYKVLATYDPEVLTQIMNATTVPRVRMDKIQQNPSTGQIVPKYNYYGAMGSNPEIIPEEYTTLDMFPDYLPLNFKGVVQPTPAQVVEATRLTALGSVKVKSEKDNTKYVLIPKTCGTEVVKSISIIHKKVDASGVESWMKDNYSIGQMNTSLALPFDWRPPYINLSFRSGDKQLSTTENVTPCYMTAVSGEFDNMSPTHWSTLKRVNDVCVYSLFGIPHV